MRERIVGETHSAWMSMRLRAMGRLQSFGDLSKSAYQIRRTEGRFNSSF